MSTSLGGLAIVTALGAAAVAGYVLVEQRSAPRDIEARLDRIAARLDEMERDLERRVVTGDSRPSLLGRGESRPAVGEAVAVVGSRGAAGEGETRAGSVAAEGPAAEAASEELATLVDEAVEKKAAQIRRMETNKKPSIGVFADTLGLSEAQRLEVERDVVQSQFRIKELLEIPTEDGTILMDELVEVLAYSVARPGEETSQRWGRFIGRLLSEEIPGSNETYAIRAERIKEDLRQSFRRDWDEKQYATFESWKMDPTEIQEIPGSPWKEVETRMIERARDLGAELPDPADE